MSDFLAEERRRLIVDRLRHARRVRVTALASELSVTEETVRRDLKLLDEQGVLTRTHGGALAIEPAVEANPFAIDLPFEERRKAMQPQKRALAREAFGRIRGPATVALDGSTTAWELAMLLSDPSLTVVTNSMIITTLLGSRPGPRVVCVGGSLDRDLMIFTGMIALEGLRHMQIDQFFCSCGGVNGQRGFSDPSEAAAQFKRQLITVADQTIVLADSTKFSSRAPVMFAAPQDVNELITDSAADTAAINQLRGSGLTCTTIEMGAAA